MSDSKIITLSIVGELLTHKIFKGFGADYGKCASKKEVYLRYKLHLLAAIDSFITDAAITSANIGDRAAE